MLVALAAALVVWQRPGHKSDDGVPAVVAIPPNATSVLNSQFRALTAASTEKAFIAAAGGTRAARTFARNAWSAREALGATRVELRYVTGGDVADRSDGSSVATVSVTWQPGKASGLASSPRHSSSVRFRMAPQKGGTFAVVGAAADSAALPIWLAGKLTVDRQPGLVVMRLDGGDNRQPVDAMVAEARAGVLRVVPHASGSLAVLSPHTQEEMAQLVGQKVANVKQIAAVSTQLDARGEPSAGSVIVLNPAVFATMDRRAAQVVLTHEATHVLTKAVGTRAETWVVEGFADFVALHDDSAGLSLSAGQILAEVKAGDGPKHLPSAADFSATKHGLGAVYESAWMIFRLLAATYGDAKVETFYAQVLGGKPLDRALSSSFGLTEAELTSRWRSYLAKSASTVS
ncbi:MAG: hypothetical protein QOJ72_2317 [Nocardioidaceae bacterium]|nr:hypothetical protein [Nocardioidaceae bacterium]